ncbi:MAG: UDP-N-acetylmuramate dehydrogenase [Patescibacteria group bacterium]|nr:UDP-N-acetylmuramate dehydrogenase [Patescibacteria group bacterium]
MKVQEHTSLKDHTTFRLGGEARYFIECIDEQEVKEAIMFAKEKDLPLFVLGGGSNTIFTDDGFPGVVLHIAICGVQVIQGIHDEAIVLVQAGEEWDGFIEQAMEEGFYGLENLSLIPGTVGGAPVQNIGAYGVEVSQFIEQVTVFDTKENSKKVFSNADCRFGYRTSVFKEEKERYIILSVMFRLQKVFSPNLSYKDIAKELDGKDVTPELLRETIIAIRTRKLPDWRKLGTAGSFFKNPELTKEEVGVLLAKYPEVPMYPHEDRFKVSAGYLIEHIAHMKGEKRGGVGVYDKHALVLVNYGEGTYDELEVLIKEIWYKVKKETGISLEPEVNIV